MSESQLQAERPIGSYVLLEKLGAGGIGEVWKARDSRLNRVVALKFIAEERRGSSPMDELWREARAASALNHPNILTIFEVGEVGGQTFLVMEFVEGCTLRQRLEQGPVPLEEAIRIGSQVCEGLAAAHRKGIVHRDLKPENVMIRADGYVKLLDFGLAKLLPWARAGAVGTAATLTAGTQTGHLVGTFNYMSPEQARGQTVDAASDVFSFGIIFYEVLTGRHPFRTESVMDTLFAIMNREPEPVSKSNPAVPAAMAEVVSVSLRKDPAQRFHSMAEVHESLNTARTTLVSPAASAPAIRHQPAWVRAVGVALIVLLLVLGVWFYRAARRSGQARSGVNSVAVMAFRAESDDSRAQTLARGLPEDLSTELASEGLRVAGMGTVATLGNNTDPRAAGAQLAVDAVIAGTVRSYDGRFKVHVELVSTRTGFQVWSRTFTVESGDLLQGEQKAAAEIATSLRTTLASMR